MERSVFQKPIRNIGFSVVLTVIVERIVLIVVSFNHFSQRVVLAEREYGSASATVLPRRDGERRLLLSGRLPHAGLVQVKSTWAGAPGGGTDWPAGGGDPPLG